MAATDKYPTIEICGHRWEASRVETVTLPVLHVCADSRLEHPMGADGVGQPFPVHHCACGATAPSPPAAQATGLPGR